MTADAPPSPILAAADAVQEALLAAQVRTIGQLLDYLEVVDREGFHALCLHAHGLTARWATQGVSAADQVLFLAATYLAFGARLGKEGLV